MEADSLNPLDPQTLAPVGVYAITGSSSAYEVGPDPTSRKVAGKDHGAKRCVVGGMPLKPLRPDPFAATFAELPGLAGFGLRDIAAGPPPS